MDRGHLSQYFIGVACKSLSAVEADLFVSHQHEWNGVEALKKLFSQAAGKRKFPASFLYLADHDDEPVTADGYVTWYDARKQHPTRSEHRLYFPTTEVSNCAAEGDTLVIGLRPDGSVLIIIAENGSTMANQIRWLFGFSEKTHPGFSVRSELECDQDRIGFASQVVLEQIGVQVETTEVNFLDEMLCRFRGGFPTYREFSEYARSTLKHVDLRDDVDSALMAYIEREEVLFRTLERHQVGDRLRIGFANDVDGFVSYSSSVQNRRKSRAGSSLENHLEFIFCQYGIEHSRMPVTHRKEKAYFIFPGIQHYRDPRFDASRLTVLGVKSSCKEGWRQVLSEVERVQVRHLFTLEPGISENQTGQMAGSNLQLVLPAAIHNTYRPAQQRGLLSFADFIRLVEARQL